MKQTLSINGPRSWATLIIVGGAALSFPFLRKDQPPTSGSDQIVKAPDYSQNSWPDVRVQQLESEQKQPSSLSDEDWNDLAKLHRSKANNHSGNPAFPSTAPLPKWADHGARVDQIVSAQMNHTPLPNEAPIAKEAITPFSTWVDPKLSIDPAPVLVNHGPAEPNFVTNDNDSRWESTNSVQNSLGSLAAGSAVKPFETKPKMWPDELKMQNQNSTQIAKTPKSRSDKNIVAYQPWNEHHEPSKPSIVSTPISPNHSSTAKVGSKPDLPAPNSSSYGGPQRVVQFQPPQVPPTGTANSRSKHFIQQPTKGSNLRNKEETFQARPN
jgi:hypothetical protein